MNRAISNPLFSCYSALFNMLFLGFSNSGIAGIATMRFHKSNFSESIYMYDFIRFLPILKVGDRLVAIPAIPAIPLFRYSQSGS